MIEDLLSYPFDQNLLGIEAEHATLFINCAPHQTIFDCVDSDALNFYAHHQKAFLEKNVNAFQAIPSDKEYDFIFIAMPKQKNEGLGFLNLARKHLKKDGTILALLSNDMGGKNLKKIMNDYGFEGESYSKSKSRIFVGQKTNSDKINNHDVDNIAMQSKALDGISYQTQPGIFGWDKIDQGSRLLTNCLPEDLKGTGADFGCGYGYLSRYICEHIGGVHKLYAIDVDYRAVQATKANLIPYQGQIEIECLWHDLTAPPALKPLDWIVMNPPFHQGKAIKIDLGVALIKTARDCLRSGGALYMVANTHLPYERPLDDIFRSYDILEQKNGFKIIKAIR